VTTDWLGRLPAGSKARVRQATIGYSFQRFLDSEFDEGYVDGMQSWVVCMTDREAEAAMASMELFRVPLRTGREVWDDVDATGHVPAEPLLDIVEQGSDWVTDRVQKLLYGAGTVSYSETPRLMIVAQVEVADSWQDHGIAELMLATAMTDLQDSDDLFAVAQPVPWFLHGRARSAPKARNVPVLERVGFTRFTSDVWILANWTTVWQTRLELDRRFGIRPGRRVKQLASGAYRAPRGAVKRRIRSEKAPRRNRG
jgi:hypothetical protein